MKARASYGLLLAFLLLVGVLVFNTLNFRPDVSALSDNRAVDTKIDLDRAVGNLSRSIQFKTISHQDSEKLDKAEFLAFTAWLRKAYPNVTRTMAITMVNELTPVYKWAGKNEALKPILLTAHYDVVPVSKMAEKEWDYPPYSGVVQNEFVWGRGAMDDKIALITMLEAAEGLIASGFEPERSVYFSFGHDEEVGGANGALKVVEYFQKEGVQFAWSLDEGSMVTRGVVAGLDAPLASINVAEKGFLNVELTVKSAGGHSSIPPQETAVGILSSAIYRLQENKIPGELRGLSGEFFDAISRHLPTKQRIFFANRWLFDPLLEKQLSNSTVSNALLRSTTAPTMFSGSDKANVLPTSASAVVNFRIHPADSVESVIQHVRDTIDDERIELAISNAREPSPVSDSEATGYQLIARALRGSFGPMILAPGLTVGGTDTKHYYRVADDSYRINPMLITKEDLSRMHGINERISLENIERAVIFYRYVLMHTDTH